MGRKVVFCLFLAGIFCFLIRPGQDWGEAADLPLDIQGHWAGDILQAQWQKGVLTGERAEQGYYLRPNRPLKRAELVVILLRNQYISRQPLPKEVILPSDSRGHWAAAYLAEAMASGLLRGYPDGSLKPERALTRAELAALIARLPALSTTADQKQRDFSDLAGHWAAPAIRTLTGSDLLKGYPDGNFRPEQVASRAEVAVLLERLRPGQEPPDRDRDGINDGLEARWQTLELVADSDFDGITDGEEVRLGLAPNQTDTDRDGLSDGEEILLQTDPGHWDSRGDGRADGDRLYEQVLIGADKPLQPIVTARLPAPAAYALDLREQREAEALPLQNNPARLSPALEIVAAPGRRGQLSLEADLALLAAGGKEKILLAHYQPDRGRVEYFQPQFKEDGRIQVEDIELDGTWYLVDKTRLTSGPVPDGQGGRDVLLLIDASGSMTTADRDDYRLELAQELIAHLGSRDRIGIMAFTDQTSLLVPLSADRVRAAATLAQIDADGDTDLQLAVTEAVKYMQQEGRKTADRTIVLFTEGHSTRPDVLWELGVEAAAAGIKIHTLGLGIGVHGVLRDLAEASGGQYQDDWHGEDLLALYQATVEQDSDGDSLTDEEESRGLVTCYGQIFFTDPRAADTDGDGVSDGAELGVFKGSPGPFTAQVSESGFSIRSNPLRIDSDNDGLSDKIDHRPGVRDWPVLVLVHGLNSDRTIWGIFKDKEHIVPDSLLGSLRNFGYDLNQVETFQYHSTDHVSRIAASLKTELIQGEKSRYPYGDSFSYFLVGHSKGGLVGRYLIEHQMLSRPILGLVTLGTPHRGWTLFTGIDVDLSPFSELFISGVFFPERICQALTGEHGFLPYFTVATEYNSWQDKVIIDDSEVEKHLRPGDWVVGNNNALGQGIKARQRLLLRSPEKYYHWENHHNPLFWATVRQKVEEVMGIR